MESFFEKMMRQYDVTKNGEKVDNFYLSDTRIKWWTCERGHSWEATVVEYVKTSGECPMCKEEMKSRIKTKNNSISWSEKNEIQPNDVGPYSNKKVWWVCQKGHEWMATVKSISLGHGCPYCSGRICIEGFNDFATIYPDLINEWSENNELKPSEVMPFSNKKVLWTCEYGHTWEARISERARGTRCPFCRRNKKLSRNK